MNDDINTLLFAMVPESRFTEIMRDDSEKRKQNKTCTPADQVSGVYNNHEGCEL